ncbi:MAG TPA: hypothetical protein VNR70_12805 [Steroidobacteraceae bacterium]|nr:hypothetical protein [Steroidobacteraceae bacterium]
MRSVAARVPAWMLLCALLAANVAFQRHYPPAWTDVHDLGTPPPAAAVRAAALGENVLAGYLVNLFLQNFNVPLGRVTPLADIDRPELIRWLDLATNLDPGTGYPLLLASRHFGETGSPEQRRMMLDWVYLRFGEQPNQRWPWLVHAVYVARHVLKDNALAEYYAAALRTQVTDPTAPTWVRQMDLLLHADLGQAADARAILGGLIDAGQIRSPAELKFLESRIPAVQAPVPVPVQAPVRAP